MFKSINSTKRVPLNFVNKAEDVPRLIRAYMKIKGMEAALALRPTAQQGVLVRIEKGGLALVWRSDDAGAQGGRDGSRAGHDAPCRPEVPLNAREGVRLIREAKSGLGKPGPITLRSAWRGYFHCDNGTPRVELLRKVASYGTLRIVSDPEKGWLWEVAREEKWFSRPDINEGRCNTLLEAIEQGLAATMGLLGEACSMRDSRRRAAYDNSYAVAHPIKPAPETKDPTERLKPREPKPKRTRNSTKKKSETEQTDGASRVEESGDTPVDTKRLATRRAQKTSTHPAPEAEREKTATRPKTEQEKTAARPKAEQKKTATRPEAEQGKTAMRPKAEQKKTATRPEAEQGKVTKRPGSKAGRAATSTPPGKADPDDLAPDPEKDRVLLNMFSEAVAASIRGGDV